MGRVVLPEDGAHLVANVLGEGVARQPEHLRKGLQEGDAQLLLPMKELRRANIEPTHESQQQRGSRRVTSKRVPR